MEFSHKRPDASSISITPKNNTATINEAALDTARPEQSGESVAVALPATPKSEDGCGSEIASPPNPFVQAVRYWQNFGFAVDAVSSNEANKHSPSGWTLETPDKAIADHFEQFPNDTIGAVLPDKVVAVVGKADDDALTSYLKLLPAPPLAWFKRTGTEIVLFRLSPDSKFPNSPEQPKGVSLVRPGEVVRLPVGGDLENSVSRVSDLPELSAEVFAAKPVEVVEPEPVKQKTNLLDRHSLRGRADEIRQQMVDEAPLLSQLALLGQISLWFGPTNAGKTLIFLALLMEAIADQRIKSENVYYINADDNGTGLLIKTELMDDLGCHTIAPGYGGFETEGLDDLLTKMAKNGQAKGQFVILDTAEVC